MNHRLLCWIISSIIATWFCLIFFPHFDEIQEGKKQTFLPFLSQESESNTGKNQKMIIHKILPGKI